jgi:exodeoxyribonuclease-3
LESAFFLTKKKMKIVTWNCNMAFRKKAENILALEPDILVIPECENLEKLKFKSGIALPNDSLWFGENQNKGLGIFAYGSYKFEVLEIHNPEIKTIIPVRVTGGENDFILFAIWAFNNQDEKYNYIGQVWKAIHYYENILKTQSVILVGDFNSNVIWDKPKRQHNHSDVVTKLSESNIFSVYHKHLNQIAGKELHPTFYLYRHKDKPYHIDYCFASNDFIEKLKTVEVGNYEDWVRFSDHKPLSVTFL